MEVLMIGKPAMNVYLPLQEFPEEGDIFNIKSKTESLGNVSATAACLLGKWGLNSNFTGIVGNDGYGEKIKDIFKEHNVKSKYVETDFTRGTSCNYIVLNVKTGMVTKVLQNDPEMCLTRYKYDFKPDWAIIDGTDQAGAHALLNNDGSVKTVFYARVGDRDTISMSKRCTHVVCTQTFAEQLTKTTTDYTADSLVAFYQRIVDAVGSSNYIVILNNHKVLYSEDGKVKMLPEMKINEADKSSFDSVFVASFTYSLIIGLDINDSIKLANTAAAISLCKIGEVNAIPDLSEVLQNSGLTEKIEALKNGTPVQSSENTAPAPLQADTNTQVVENTPEVPVESAPVQSTEVVQDAFNQAPVEAVQPQMVQENMVQAPAPEIVPQAVQQEVVQMPAPAPEMPMQVDSTNTTNV